MMALVSMLAGYHRLELSVKQRGMQSGAVSQSATYSSVLTHRLHTLLRRAVPWCVLLQS